MSENIQENKMGVMPVPKLLFNMAIPMVVSMLMQALYNIVDSAFVGMYSTHALEAVSIAFPIQNLMIAFATGTGVVLMHCFLDTSVKKSLKRQIQQLIQVCFLQYAVIYSLRYWDLR